MADATYPRVHEDKIHLGEGEDDLQHGVHTAHSLKPRYNSRTHVKTEPVFLNFYGAQKSVPPTYVMKKISVNITHP